MVYFSPPSPFFPSTLMPGIPWGPLGAGPQLLLVWGPRGEKQIQSLPSPRSPPAGQMQIKGKPCSQPCCGSWGREDKASLHFQELGSFSIGAWRYAHNFRKCIGCSASADLILICELGFFFLAKLFRELYSAQIRIRRQKGWCVPVLLYFSFQLTINRTEK